MNSLPCDIVLLPSDELTDYAVEVSKSLQKYDANFTLGVGKCYPHMSLYMFQLNVDDIPRIEATLKRIAKDFPAYAATATTYTMDEGHAAGSVFPQYEITPKLRKLQEDVITAVNPIRCGMREKDKAKMVDATGVKLQNLQQFGYPSIGELFHAHITLTRLKGYRPEVLQTLPDIQSFSGTFNRIGLFEMGDFGTCIRPLAIVDLPIQ